jgi:hypothetical protein
MRFKGTYLLAVVFLSVAAYVYFYEVKGAEEQKKIEEAEKNVFEMDKDKVSSIYLRNYSDSFRIERGPTGWEIEEPIKTPADDDQVDLILTSLENAEIERVVVDSASDLSAFGLDKPQVELQLGTDETQFDTLFIGSHNPTQSFVYSRLSGEKRVFLLPSSVYNNVSKKLFAIRDKTVLSFNKDDVRRVSLDRRDDTLVFEKEGDKWRIKGPIDARADKSRIDQVLNSLSALKAKEFADEGGAKLSRFELDHPWGKVDLYLGDNLEMKSLLLGGTKGKAGDVYAKDVSRDPVFVIPSYFVKQVTKELDDFRDKKLLEFEKDQLKEIRLTDPLRTIICEKDTTGDWYYYTGKDPVRYPASSSAIDRLVSDLSSLHIQSFVGVQGKTLRPYGLDNPQSTVLLNEKNGGKVTLSIGKKVVEKEGGKAKEYLYAMNDRDGWIYTVGGSTLGKLKVSVDDLKVKAEGESTVKGAKKDIK